MSNGPLATSRMEIAPAAHSTLEGFGAAPEIDRGSPLVISPFVGFGTRAGRRLACWPEPGSTDPIVAYAYNGANFWLLPPALVAVLRRFAGARGRSLNDALRDAPSLDAAAFAGNVRILLEREILLHAERATLFEGIRLALRTRHAERWQQAGCFARYAFAAQWLRPGAAYLDIGCPAGPELALLQPYCGSILALQPDPELHATLEFHYGSDRLRYRVARYEQEWDFAAGQFDVVSAFNSFEHIARAAGRIQALRNIERALADGGIGIISVPDERGWGRLDRLDDGTDDGQHYKHETPRSWVELARPYFEPLFYYIQPFNSVFLHGPWDLAQVEGPQIHFAPQAIDVFVIVFRKRSLSERRSPGEAGSPVKRV